MNTDEFNTAAERRLFRAMQECLDGFLRANAPLYNIAQIGVIHDFNSEDIELRIHLKQTGKVSVQSEQGRHWLPIYPIAATKGAAKP